MSVSGETLPCITPGKCSPRSPVSKISEEWTVSWPCWDPGSTSYSVLVLRGYTSLRPTVKLPKWPIRWHTKQAVALNSRSCLDIICLVVDSTRSLRMKKSILKPFWRSYSIISLLQVFRWLKGKQMNPTPSMQSKYLMVFQIWCLALSRRNYLR